MKDQSKTKQVLIQELVSLRKRIAEPEQAESGRKQAEEALRRSEEKYRNLFDNSAEGIYQVSPEGRFISANPAAARILGYESPEELIGTVTDIGSQVYAHPEDRDKALALLRKDGFFKNFEVRNRQKNGSIVWVLANVHTVRDDQSSILYHEGTSKDITDRKRAEDALRKEKDFAESLIQTAQTIVLVLDTTGRIVNFNSYMEEISGYTLKEVQGKDWFSTFLPEHIRDSVKELFLNAVSDIQTQGNVDLIVTKDGRERLIEWYDKTLKDEKGNTVGLLAIGQDITDRKKTEEALRESEEKFRTIFDRAIDGILIADAQNKKFLQGNAAICSMLGYTQKEIKNLTIYDLHRQKDISHVLDEFEKLIKGEKSLTEDLPVLRKDGSIFYADVSSTSTTIEGRHHLVGIFRDITERKQAEEALRESEERYRSLVENASDIVFRLDDTGHITFVNPAALRIMGYEEKEIMGRYYPTFIRSDMQEEAMNFFGRQFVKRIPNTYSEYPVIVKDGREIWLGQNTQLICQDDKVVAIQAVARDITERKRIGEALQDSENRYRELCIIDDLTQLYNSRYFYHNLKIEMDRADRYGQPLTLLLLDLDNFKRFNDAYGHVKGDQVLLRLGQVVKRCLRQTDSAYRYGGEEFTVLLPMTTSVKGAITAERIRTEFKEETFSPAQGQAVHVTVSIGLGQYKPQEDMKAFVHRVDQLMYQGKENGKDRVCSEP